LPALAVPLHEFVRALRVQAQVTVTPGTEFSPDATDSIRLNFSQNHKAAVEAVERIAQMIARYLKHPAAQIRAIPVLLQVAVELQERLLYPVIRIRRGCAGGQQVAAQGSAQFVEPAKHLVAYWVNRAPGLGKARHFPVRHQVEIHVSRGLLTEDNDSGGKVIATRR